jgi:hypothetical protein
MSLDSPGDHPVRGVSEDLLVTSLSVQGGEAVIGDEKAAFARILMSGVRLQNMKLPPDRVKTRQVALLKLDLAEELAVRLREIMNLWARSSPTPVLPARGTWSWNSEPLPSDDILVSQVKAGREEIQATGQTTPIVRLDFTGALLKASTSGLPPARMPAAIFTVPRHVQSLISSLKKCTLALRPQSELHYLGFAIPSLDATSSGELQPSWPQQ